MGLSGILADIVRDVLEAASDMTVVGELPDADRLADTLERTQADVVIWGVDEGHRSDPPDYLLGEYARPNILAVEGDGVRGVLWNLRPVRTPLGELSPSSLVSHIGRAVSSRT